MTYGKTSWKRWASSALMTLVTLMQVSPAWAMDYNMTPGVTPISHDLYDLHMTIFWICVAIGVAVYGVLIYSLIHFRRSKGAKSAKWHESLKVELIWTIIPLIILIIMAIPATLVLMRMSDDADADVNIKITGYQWKWRYEYLDHGISYFSSLSTPMNQRDNTAPKSEWYLLEVDHPLVVPTHKKIRFLVTANDVIHSWWVPALGVKRDAIPGFIYEAWARIETPGVYRGQCAELCGVGHGFMPIVVIAKPPAEYRKWLIAHGAAGLPSRAAKPPKDMSKDALMTLGHTQYSQHCAVCHKPTGVGMPPAFPALKGGAIATGPVDQHIHMVLFGKTGTAMQAFRDQLNDQEIAAIVTYERNAWGNSDQSKYGRFAGGVVQPKDVHAMRDAE